MSTRARRPMLWIAVAFVAVALGAVGFVIAMHSGDRTPDAPALAAPVTGATADAAAAIAPSADATAADPAVAGATDDAGGDADLTAPPPPPPGTKLHLTHQRPVGPHRTPSRIHPRPVPHPDGSANGSAD